MAYLEEKRKELTVPAAGALEIRVDFHPLPGEEAAGAVWIQCLSCDREVAPIPERQLFECPECGYNTTRAEIVELAQRQIERIETVLGVPRRRKKGLLWRFIGLFVRKKRQKT